MARIREALLRAVETRVAATRSLVSAGDIGSRRLDALIVSVN